MAEAIFDFFLLSYVFSLLTVILRKKLRWPEAKWLSASLYHYAIMMLASYLMHAWWSPKDLYWTEQRVWSKLDGEGVLSFVLPLLVVDAAFAVGLRAHAVVAELAAIVAYTVGTLVATALCYTLLTRLFYGHEMPGPRQWQAAALIVFALGGTDVAAVGSLVRDNRLRHGAHVYLVAEALLSSACAVALLDWLKQNVSDDVHASVWLYLQSLAARAFLFCLSAVVGWLSARVVVLQAQHLFSENVRAQQAVVILMAFFCYGAATSFAGSGLLAVAVFGLSLAREREHFGRRAIGEITVFLNIVGYHCESLMFSYAGYEAGSFLAKYNYKPLSVFFFSGLAAYSMLFVARFFALVLMRIGSRLVARPRSSNARDFALFWGGVRGGIAVLAVHSLDDDAKKVLEGLGVDFEWLKPIVASCVLFSLLVDATFFRAAADECDALLVTRAEVVLAQQAVDSRLDPAAAAVDEPVAVPVVRARLIALGRLEQTVIGRRDERHPLVPVDRSDCEQRARQMAFECLRFAIVKLKNVGVVDTTSYMYAANISLRAIDQRSLSAVAVRRFTDDRKQWWPDRCVASARHVLSRCSLSRIFLRPVRLLLCHLVNRAGLDERIIFSTRNVLREALQDAERSVEQAAQSEEELAHGLVALSGVRCLLVEHAAPLMQARALTTRRLRMRLVKLLHEAHGFAAACGMDEEEAETALVDPVELAIKAVPRLFYLE